MQIVAAFDVNADMIGTAVNHKKIFHISEMSNVAPRLQAHIGIITVPAGEAQRVCDLMLLCGVQAIWNFAPVHLHVPKHILVQNENFAASLSALSRKLEEALNEREK